MPIFKRKSGPLLRWSRLAHFTWGVIAVGGGAYKWGDAGAAIATVGTDVLGLGWELSNKITPGYHPYADVADFGAFHLGAGVALFIWIIFGGGQP